MAAKKSKFQQKMDGFLRALFLDENGKPKSASMLYSFLFALLFIVIYVFSYILLLGPIERALSGASVLTRNLAEYILPALAGSAVCMLFMLLPVRMKGLVAAAYIWIAVLVVLMMLFELLMIDWNDAATDYGLFMVILGWPALCSVITGGIPALLIIRSVRKKQAAQAAAEEKERPSWYK